MFEISPLFAALNLLLLTGLAANVSRVRISSQVSLGDGGDKRLRAAIRTHGNAVEHALPFLILLFFLDMLRVTPTLVLVLAISFTLARVCHVWGMLGRVFVLRQGSAGVTLVVEAAMCILLLVGAS